MRTQPRLGRFIRVIAGASLLACASTDTFAQGAGKETPTAGQNAAAAPSYDLEIKDNVLVWNGAKRKDNASGVPANLENVVDLLRELYPEANFVVSPGLGSTVFTDLKLRTSTVEDKLEAIRVAGGSQFLWRPVRQSGTANDPGKTLYVVDALPETKPGLQVEAFNLGAYLDHMYGEAPASIQKRNNEQMEQIEQMVRETVQEYRHISEASNKSKAKTLPMPSIRFHSGANLAVIIGQPEAVAVAAKVIGALPGAQRSVANAPGNDEPSQKVDDVIKRLQREGVLPAPRR